jgi:hypothetical protein
MSKRKKIWLWIISIFVFLILLAATIAYFKFNQVVKNRLEEAIAKSSKGLYHADIKRVSYSIFTGNLRVRKLSLVPDTAVWEARMLVDSAPAMRIYALIDKIVIKDIHLRHALLFKEVKVPNILIEGPDIRIAKLKKAVVDTTPKKRDTILSVPLPKALHRIEVDQLIIRDGRFSFNDLTRVTQKEVIIPSFDIEVDTFSIDSSWRTDPRIYNANNIKITLHDIAYPLPNDMYRIDAGKIALSIKDKSLIIKQFHLVPLFNREQFCRKLGYQTDRMDLQVGTFLLSGINYEKLLGWNKLDVRSLLIDSLNLKDYRDKRIAMRPGFKPPMPQQLLRDAKMGITIDSVIITNGYAKYSEQVGPEPGYLFFDQISGVIHPLSNDSLFLADKRTTTLKARALLMGEGELNATIEFVFGDKDNRFVLSGSLAHYNLSGVNPMLTKLLPARINSGKVQRLHIPKIWYNDDVASGSLVMYYTNLDFEILNQKHTKWSSVKTGVLNWVAGDILISKSNPGPKGKLRTGVVYFQRDKHKSIINFIWKSVLSGLKSNIGFNNKQQKVVKKQVQKTTRKNAKSAKH